MEQADILTRRQQAFLRRIAREPDIAREYVLSGGTALAAFHLRHRRSDDLDLFTRQHVDLDRMIAFMEACRTELNGEKLGWQKLYDRRIFVLQFFGGEELKVEFTRYPYAHLEQPTLQDGILVASVRDIAAGKLTAILDRNEPKDYYDLYFLLIGGHTTLQAMLRDVEAKFKRVIDPLHLGSQLECGTRLVAIPHLRRPVAKEDVQRFFRDLAKSLRSDIVEE
ncbi:nucleotidyl transferase AbiEii/AbiGii toxin family protein [Candidatus Peregrinibacteria bacterium]|nr:nucleotidyl transferase AbiEii/AbiGii toxin family protein [Candidatus Peregrinibacteria bacterium]